MATELDNDLVPEIGALINDEVGTDATFREVVAGGVYTLPGSFTTAKTLSNVVWKITPPQPYGPFLVDGDVIQADDLRTLIAAEGLTFTPLVERHVVFAGKTYTIMAVTPIRSGDLVCAYELQLRRGAA